VELTKLISKRWREADSVTRGYCRDLAERELKRYRDEMKAYVGRYGVDAGRTKSKNKGGSGRSGSGSGRGSNKSSRGNQRRGCRRENTTKGPGGGGGGGDETDETTMSTMSSMKSLLKSKEDLLIQENLNLMLKNQAAILAASSSSSTTRGGNTNIAPSALAFSPFHTSCFDNNGIGDRSNNNINNNGFVGCNDNTNFNMQQRQQPCNLANRLQMQVREEALKLRGRVLRCQQQQQQHHHQPPASSLDCDNPNMLQPSMVPPAYHSQSRPPPPQNQGRTTMMTTTMTTTMPQFDFTSRARDHHRKLMEEYQRISDAMMSQEDAMGHLGRRQQARMEDHPAWDLCGENSVNNNTNMNMTSNNRKMMTMTTLKDQGQLPPLFEHEEYREENYGDFFDAERSDAHHHHPHRNATSPQGGIDDNTNNDGVVGGFDDVFVPIDSSPATATVPDDVPHGDSPAMGSNDLYDDDCSVVGLKSPAIAASPAIASPCDEDALALTTPGDPVGCDGGGIEATTMTNDANADFDEWNDDANDACASLSPSPTDTANNNNNGQQHRAKSISPVPEYNIAPEISFLAKNFVNEFSRYLNHDHEVQKDELEAIGIDNNQGMGMGGARASSSNSLLDDNIGGGYGDVFAQEKGGYQQPSPQGNGTVKMGTSASTAAKGKDSSLLENTGVNNTTYGMPLDFEGGSFNHDASISKPIKNGVGPVYNKGYFSPPGGNSPSKKRVHVMNYTNTMGLSSSHATNGGGGGNGGYGLFKKLEKRPIHQQQQQQQMFQPYHSTNTPAYDVHTTKKQRSSITSPAIADDMSRDLSREDINAWMKDILT